MTQAQVAGVVRADPQARGAGGGGRAVPVHHARQLQGPLHDQQEVRSQLHARCSQLDRHAAAVGAECSAIVHGNCKARTVVNEEVRHFSNASTLFG